MSDTTRYFCLVAPLTYTGTVSSGFTYHSEEPLVAGQVVEIPLGRRTSLGVVTETEVARPSFATKAVSTVLELPPLPVHLIELATWMAEYYYSSPKAVWQTLLPAGITRKRRSPKEVAAEFSLPKPEHALTQEQEAALQQIQNDSGTTTLLQGVTGSGKTRIYIELAARELAAGRSAVIMVPEIALTPQLLALFEASFPGRIIAYHSGLTEAQKHLAWQLALETPEPVVVVGPRSSLLLPLARPGVIVIDECHESSYKQEQNPRYHAVAVAAKLAHLTGAKLVLGSATPGLPEVYATEQGRITLVRLLHRVAGRPMPETLVVDMRKPEGRGKNTWLSVPLMAALTETLTAGRQSLLFINRRGTASSQICNNCGEVTTCPNCHLPLTFHADTLQLICHLCGFHQTPAATCPHCNQPELRYLGGGTKRIETEVARLFPEARLLRIDKDSATAKTLPQMYSDLHAGKVDILIGTQMIAKGLDLPQLDTVGVVNADQLLHMPDFTSAERTFQLVAQVAGRAGRGTQPGRVIIQTRTPEHPAIQAAAAHDFWTFATAELESRKLLGYPPHRYLLKASYSHKEQATATREARALCDRLKTQPGIRVLGPAPAFHERAGGTYTWQVVIKAARRSVLLAIARELPATWKTDLDPVNLL